MKVPLENLYNNNLKILHLIQKPQYRGAEIFTCQLAKHQKKLGHEAIIVSIFEGEIELDWDDEIINLKGKVNLRFMDFNAWRNLNQLIKDFKPDIIQANAGDTLKYAVFSKKVFGWSSPIVFRNASEVGRYLTSRLQKQLNSYLYKNVCAVASVSVASEKDLIQYFPFLKGKTKIISVGLEEKELINPIQFKPDSHKHIIHVGGFSFEKNHKGLINIFKKIIDKKKNVSLHLVGDGPLRMNIESLVNKADLQDRIKFYGFVTNPIDFIAGADVLVLPSIIEGLPGVLLEAMYCKTPVVAYDVGGIREIVTPETGKLISKNEEKEFVRATLKAFTTSHIGQINKASTMVREKFMNKQIAKDFICLYRRVLKLE